MKQTVFHKILTWILVLALCFGYLPPMHLHAHAVEEVPLYLELTPQDYLTVSNDSTEKLACGPGLVALDDGYFAVTYLADEVNTVETESSTTIVCRLGIFHISDPENGTFLDVATAGQTIGNVKIGKKAPYEPNLLKLNEETLVVLFNLRDTSGRYIYYSALFDTQTNEITSYAPLTLDGREWTPANVAASYNAIADNSISASGPSSSMVFTSKIVEHNGWFYGYCGGICAGFSGILVRSKDGINWESVLAPEAALEMNGVIECGFAFLDDHIYLCMRDISSGVYQGSYRLSDGAQVVKTQKMTGLTTSKPAAFLQDGEMYVIVNALTGDESTVARRNTALFYKVNPKTCELQLVKRVFCGDGCAYHTVVEYQGKNYWCFHTDARRINPYTQGRSNLAFLEIPDFAEPASMGGSGILNWDYYSHCRARGCITVAQNVWVSNAVNYSYQIPLSDFNLCDTVTITANPEQKAYIAFLSDHMDANGAVAYAEGWSETLIMEAGTTQVLHIPSDAEYLYIIENNAAGNSLLPSKVEFHLTESCADSYKNGTCEICGERNSQIPYDQLSTVWPSVNTDLTHIICYGQSFSTGSDAPYYADATVDGVYVYGNIANSAKGTALTALSSSAGNQHPIISAGNVLAQLLKKAGYDTDIVLGSYGSGGKTIAQLMSSDRQSQIKQEEGYTYDILSSGRYEVFQNSVSALAEYAQKNNQSISCPAIVYLQGETDQNTDAQLGYPENPARAGYGAGGDKEKYKEYMSRLKEDMQREVMEQYAQTEKPLFLIYQVSGTYTRTQYSSINMAQIEFAQENEDVILVQSPYFASHYTNSHHLTQNGYRWLGEYIGRSIYTALVEREKPWPLLPERIEITGSNTVSIMVSGAQNGLTIDTWTVENASNSKNLYGFYVQADGTYIVPSEIIIRGNTIDLVLPKDLTSKTAYVNYAGKNASGTGNIRDNSTALGFYDYLDDSNDTGTGNNQGVSHSSLDANGKSIIGQKYPLYNWLSSFCYEVEVPEAAQKQPAYYHWEMNDTGLVSVTDGDAVENKLTLVQGTVTDGLLNGVQYNMDQGILLKHDRTWVIEWKAAGNGSSFGGGKLLSSSGSNDSYAQYLYTPADSRGLVAWGVGDLSANYGFQLKEYGIDPRQEHIYRIENRIEEDGSNNIYLFVDGAEIGAMNTGYRISSNTSGAAGSKIEEPYNWANGKNLYMDSIGAGGSFLLKNMKLFYLKVWESRPHTHNYKSTVMAPTYTEQGYTTHTCSICGDSYVDSYTDIRPLNILMIGNSFSWDAADFWYDMQTSMTYDAMKAMLSEQYDVHLAVMYKGSATLSYHATCAEKNTAAYTFQEIGPETGYTWKPSSGKNATNNILDHLQERDWDIIVIQSYQHEADGTEPRSTYTGGSAKFEDPSASLGYLLDYFAQNESGAEVYYYMPWASTKFYGSDGTAAGYAGIGAYTENEIRYMTGTTSGKKLAGIIPVGTAIENARTTYLHELRYNSGKGETALLQDPQIGLQYDSQHLSFSVGRYIAGLTVAQSLIPQQMRKTDISWPDMKGSPSVGELPIEYNVIARQAVTNAMKTPYHITPIYGYEVDPAERVCDTLSAVNLSGKGLSDETSVRNYLENIIKEALTGMGNAEFDLVIRNYQLQNGSIWDLDATVTVRIGYTSATAQLVKTDGTDHLFGQWIHITAPSANALGLDQRVCLKCGFVENREVEGSWQKYALSKHLQALPSGYCNQTNLWDLLTPESVMLDQNGNWVSAGANVYSVTIPVKPGDQIYANSFGITGSTKGIQVSFIGDYGIIKTTFSSQTYQEFNANGGYLVAPEGTIAVNVPVWNYKADNELFILNAAEHSYTAKVVAPTCTEQGYTTHTCACGESYVDSYVDALGHRYQNHVCAICGTAQWDTDGDGVLEILAIGNSFSVDALEYAYQIATDLGISEVVIGNLYIGGCSLETHAANAAGDLKKYTYYYNDNGIWTSTGSYKISTALESRSWDFVSLQQASAYSGVESSYNEDLTDLIDYVRTRSDAKLVWNMTWAYQQDSTHSAFPTYGKDQMTMYNAIVSCVQNKILTNGNFDLIVPNGTAVQNSRTSILGDTTTRDGYHMSKDYGRYLTGLMFVKTVTGLSVDNVSYAPAGVDAEEKRIAIESVNNAAQSPYAVTKSAYSEEPPMDGYVLLTPQLYQGAYWHPLKEGRHNELITDMENCYKFFTTVRFTRDTLPVGSVIYLQKGWQYRPDGWVTDVLQTGTRESNTTAGCVVITEEWWGDYTIRSFNISRTDGGSVMDLSEDDLRTVFRIYVPEEKHVHQFLNGICSLCGYVNTGAAELWVTGTIDSKTGLDKAGDTRLRTSQYLSLKDYAGVSIGQGHTVTWFAYDASGNYLGTSGFLDCGMGFSTEEIALIYPSAVTFRIALRADAAVKMDPAEIVSTGFVFYAPGEKVPGLTEKVTYEDLFSIGSWQEGAIYGGKLFLLNGSGSGAVYDMTSGIKLGNLTLQKTDVLKPHANSICFGTEFYAESDPFPLLYVNIYNNYSSGADRMEGVCCVYRLVSGGANYVGELVQVIKIGFTEDLTLWKSLENNKDVRPYGNFLVDRENGKLYAYVMRDGTQKTRFFRFDLPSLSQGTYNSTYGCNVVTLTKDMIQKQFDTVYFNYLQGGTCYGGKIISAEGISAAKNALRIVDLKTGKLEVTYSLYASGLTKEPEVVAHDPATGEIYYAAADGILRKLNIETVAHTHNYTASVTQPTCTEQGYTTHNCAICGDRYQDNQVAAKGHKWTAATCETAKTCSVCNKTEGSAIGHKWNAATCETAKTCSVCKKTEGAAAGHKWTAATCETAKTCSVCKKTEGAAAGHKWTAATCEAAKTCSVCKKSEGSATGHKWTAATCESAKTCSVCKKTEGSAIGHKWTAATCESAKTCSICKKTEGSAIGHKWTAATCETAKTCSVCKKTEGSAAGHKWNAATCETAKTCSVCKKTEGSATGHKWTAATCETAKTCSVCKKTEGAAVGHKWTAATCETARTCSVCKKTEGSAIGHKWNAATCETAKTCSVCKKTEGSAAGHKWDSGTVTKPATETTEGVKTYKCTSCSKTRTETIPMLSHTHKYDKVVTAPTCIEQGYSTYTCKCGHSYVDNYVKATGHKAVTDKAVAATCTKTGLTAGSHCSVCGVTIKAQEIVPATGHAWDKGTVTKPATEEAEGVMTYKCSSCGETKTSAIPVLSHTHKYEKIVTAPTCTEQGYSTYTCKCGHTYVDNYTNATGHKAVTDAAVAATCTKTGLTAGSHCSVCGVVIKKQETVPATGHSWDKGTVTKPATEETEGVMTYKCSSCGETKTVSIPVLSHTHKYEKVVTNPTCTEQGYSTYTCKCGHTYVDNYVKATGHKAVTDKAVAATCTKTGLTAGSHCSVCGVKIKAQETVPATGHNWDKGTVTKPATEEAEGVMTYKCSSCGETKTATIPMLSHIHKYEKVVTNPTCTEQGYSTYTCKCGHSYVDNYTNATGHKAVTDAAVAATCTKTGLTAGSHCSVCGVTTKAQETISATGHSWDKGTVTKPATEETEGVMTYKCTSCGETKTATIPVLGHVHRYEAEVTEATCTDDGFTTYSCVCGDSYTDAIIEALGHDWIEATCLAPKTCDRCGIEEGEALGHSFSEWRLLHRPSCTSKGQQIRICDCGAEEIETIPMIDHDYRDFHCKTCKAELKEIQLGDVNGDNKLTYEDALKILRYSINLEDLKFVSLADINGDGNVNYSDALTILRRSIGLE